jgi:outer membrane receptor protein involved in Fe transport
VPGQNYVASPTGSDDHNKFDVRLDHRIGDNGLLGARYSFSDSTRVTPYGAAGFSSLPGYGNDIDERGQNAMLSETHSFGVRWVNEARLGFNQVDSRTFHTNSGSSLNSLVGLPDFATRSEDLGLSFIEVTGFSSLGSEFNNPQDSVTDSYQVSDTVSGSIGDHQLRFGFEQRWVRGDAFRHVLSRGQLGFTDFAYSQNALADLLLGLPSFTGGGSGDNDQNQRTWATNLFVQDNWRVRRNLTLTLGLRYEYNQPAYDAFDNAAIYDGASQQIVQLGTNGVPRGGYEPDKNNFAPRIGLAWSPGSSGKTVVRTGYGIH